MRWLLLTLLTLALQLDPAFAAPMAVAGSVPGSFITLSYHEVRDEIRDYPDPYAVDSASLVRQFAWLRGNGYSPVSLDEIIAARRGGKPLPKRAVLLTFDDAYLSFYTRVYPILREFNFPAVLAVVGRWIDNPQSELMLYGETESVHDASFATWNQLREMADSGLIELASHTYDLHRGIPANPQGNLSPAATTRAYDALNNSYEDDLTWRARVRGDLARNIEVIERNTGHRPRVMVWPYGSYNDELVHIAGELKLPVAVTLDDGTNTPDVPLTAIRRVLIEHSPTLADFVAEVQGPRNPEPVRVVQIDLDSIYSADSAQQELNLSLLLDRIEVLQPTHVYLQATTNTGGDVVTNAAYFPNRHLLLRADLFNRVSWQITTRVGARVFAVMPIRMDNMSADSVSEVYEDLARHASFSGLVFEGNSPADDADESATIKFTRQLTARVQAFRAPLQTVRSLTTEQSPICIAGELQVKKRVNTYVDSYDYVALISAPFDTTNIGLLKSLKETDLLRRTVFMLRSPVADDLARQMRHLQLGGALNFGYVPDDFLHDDPPLATMAPPMSLRVYPLKLKEQ